jgi:hypothetical protein
VSGPDVDPVEGQDEVLAAGLTAGEDQDEVLAALLQLGVMERDGTVPPCTIHLGPFTAYSLVALLQLAWRHPDLTPRQKQMAEDIGRNLQQAFREPLWSALQAGWDTGQDVSADLVKLADIDDVVAEDVVVEGAPAGPPDPVPDGARRPGGGHLTRAEADALMKWLYWCEEDPAARWPLDHLGVIRIAEDTRLSHDEIELLFNWPTLTKARTVIEEAVRLAGFGQFVPGNATAWAVISPDGQLAWYPLTATAEVEALVSGAYAPGALDRAFVSGPLRVLASDVALVAPDHYPPNPLAQKVIITLSGGRIVQPWRGHVALVQYEQATATGEWLWPGPMSPEWARCITEAAQ